MLKNRFIRQLFNSFLDLAPILAVVLIFQVLVIGQSVPNVASLITGTFFVILGLTLFIQGLELSLFPLGESMARSRPWLMIATRRQISVTSGRMCVLSSTA